MFATLWLVSHALAAIPATFAELPDNPPAMLRVARALLEQPVVIGVHVAPVDEAVAAHLGLEAGSGLMLATVLKGHPADEAGMKRFDVITEIGGKPIGSLEDLRAAMSGKQPGDTLDVVVRRGAERLELVIAVEAAQESKAAETLNVAAANDETSTALLSRLRAIETEKAALAAPGTLLAANEALNAARREMLRDEHTSLQSLLEAHRAQLAEHDARLAANRDDRAALELKLAEQASRHGDLAAHEEHLAQAHRAIEEAVRSKAEAGAADLEALLEKTHHDHIEALHAALVRNVDRIEAARADLEVKAENLRAKVEEELRAKVETLREKVSEVDVERMQADAGRIARQVELEVLAARDALLLPRENGTLSLLKKAEEAAAAGEHAIHASRERFTAIEERLARIEEKLDQLLAKRSSNH